MTLGDAAEPLVHIKNFRMDFGDTTVIRDLSFDVHAGETFGFLGSNGSGKTTTLRALLGIYQPTAGTLHIGGKVFQPRDGARLGYLPEERGLYKKEPVLDVMVYFGRLKGLSKAAARTWSEQYLERVGIPEKAKIRLDKLSGGQQQKVQLGVTIMNNPELLILDEPTKGFDPVNRRLLMDIIEEHKRAGATVIMVTHQMEEVERLCDRVILLKDGTSRAYGTVKEVQEEFGGTVYRVAYDGVLPASDLYEIIPVGDGRAELAPGQGASEEKVLRELVQAGVALRSFTPARVSLDEIFIKVYGEQHELAEAK
ncbi:ABC transporter ATP-binding protein [Pseudarthrobacter niigatensis]|uniref:ABC-2 type transport system ATP-binding protein n=1 Tax=Pseudarthrobacter niigatensis TaxID=369935 RepID=A0AAJ1SVX5_9MICC|nr:ATP-binding cassette domain-containing protein [Pseudarthrobacter niigatensis]MDQ0144752.1 ABC-2 type transport system ATP-binding protein [Pseudarthrobacter niigatensis]MDQ0265399.1 ABC-2 type transport system ATP-binding protein [Pseudarthrobacter niigatensis]